MANVINLWFALTAAEYHTRKEDGPGPRVEGGDLRELGQSARFYNQEFSVEATEAGWVIRLFPCSGDDFQDEVEILVPKDGSQPVKVVKDRIGRIAHLHS